jgi:hypothetical protein
MAIKYSKWQENIATFSFSGRSKIKIFGMKKYTIWRPCVRAKNASLSIFCAVKHMLGSNYAQFCNPIFKLRSTT